MRKAVGIMLPLVAALLAGCADPPRLSLAAAGPIPADSARVYVYRLRAPYQGVTWTTVMLNGQAIGDSAPGSGFYRDVAPGTYDVAARSQVLLPFQSKTVYVDAGGAVYVRVDTVLVWRGGEGNTLGEGFSIAIVDPEVARREITELENAAD